MKQWFQLHFDVTAEEVERVDVLLTESGACAVTVLDAIDDPLYEPAPGEVRVWAQSRVCALFETPPELAPLHAAVTVALGAPPAGWRTETLDDRDWERAWLDDFHPMRFGERLWVCPTTAEPPGSDATVLWLDPGLAFGTGTHETTALCLEWLDRHPPAGSVLDYGCGSGILAIAALLLGAEHADAVDIDPQALTATRANATVNAVAGRIAIALPEALADDARYQLVLANILAGPLVELAPQLAGRVAPGGALVLSGILAEQADAVAEAYHPWFGTLERTVRDGWVRLSGRLR